MAYNDPTISFFQGFTNRYSQLLAQQRAEDFEREKWQRADDRFNLQVGIQSKNRAEDVVFRTSQAGIAEGFKERQIAIAEETSKTNTSLAAILNPVRIDQARATLDQTRQTTKLASEAGAAAKAAAPVKQKILESQAKGAKLDATMVKAPVTAGDNDSSGFAPGTVYQTDPQGNVKILQESRETTGSDFQIVQDSTGRFARVNRLTGQSSPLSIGSEPLQGRVDPEDQVKNSFIQRNGDPTTWSEATWTKYNETAAGIKVTNQQSLSPTDIGGWPGGRISPPIAGTFLERSSLISTVIITVLLVGS